MYYASNMCEDAGISEGRGGLLHQYGKGRFMRGWMKYCEGYRKGGTEKCAEGGLGGSGGWLIGVAWLLSSIAFSRLILWPRGI